MTTESKRQILIDTALRLFSKNGYHATGIDLILSEAGVAKKTLYHHFQSKEELIIEVLRKYDLQFRQSVDTKLRKLATTPRDKLLAIYQIAHDWFADKHFYGCMFINAIGEYSDSDTSIRSICKGFKDSMRLYIYDLCVEAEFSKPDELAEELALLLEGSIVTAQVSGNPNAAFIAQRSAAVIMKNHSK